jgi:hypothetical protein
LLTAEATVGVGVLRMVLAKVKGSSILVAAQTVQTLAVGSKGPLTEAPAVLAAVRDPQAVVGAGGHVQMVHVITAIDQEALALPVDGFRPCRQTTA